MLCQGLLLVHMSCVEVLYMGREYVLESELLVSGPSYSVGAFQHIPVVMCVGLALYLRCTTQYLKKMLIIVEHVWVTSERHLRCVHVHTHTHNKAKYVLYL